MKNHQVLHFEAMWKEIGKTLKPLGQMPDKASLDYRQIFILYSEIREPGSIIKDQAQASILKKELACAFLKNLVN